MQKCRSCFFLWPPSPGMNRIEVTATKDTFQARSVHYPWRLSVHHPWRLCCWSEHGTDIIKGAYDRNGQPGHEYERGDGSPSFFHTFRHCLEVAAYGIQSFALIQQIGQEEGGRGQTFCRRSQHGICMKGFHRLAGQRSYNSLSARTEADRHRSSCTSHRPYQ